jgi:disulfide bond formation protein DsbB
MDTTMKPSKSLFLFVAALSIALLVFAVYLQIVEEMAPCPWCVIQRYIFVAIAAVSLIGVFAPNSVLRLAGIVAALLSTAGTAAAGWLLWVQAHPGVSCGIDPMETSLNTLLPAQWFPTLFKADGLCTTIYDNILGLSVSQWAFVWFIILTLVLVSGLRARR